MPEVGAVQERSICVSSFATASKAVGAAVTVNVVTEADSPDAALVPTEFIAEIL